MCYMYIIYTVIKTLITSLNIKTKSLAVTFSNDTNVSK